MIHLRHSFPCPSRKNLLDEKVVDKDGVTVGYAQIKILAEASLILDLSKSKRDRIEALNVFMDYAQEMCAAKGIEQLHVFVEDESFANLLIEKFGFSQVMARTLVKNLE